MTLQEINGKYNSYYKLYNKEARSELCNVSKKAFVAVMFIVVFLYTSWPSGLKIIFHHLEESKPQGMYNAQKQ